MLIRKLWIALCLFGAASLSAQQAAELRVGVSGSEPFVIVDHSGRKGIAVEIWQMVAARSGWRYQMKDYPNVPEAMRALGAGEIDVAIGPISITADRAQYARFSQPYYASRLAILSRTEPHNLWRRIEPFFSRSFFLAVASLLAVLAVVGALIWLAERRGADSHFPQDPLHGIGNGIWFAIVTMSTVGYGDMAPRTVLGRAVTGVWIIISVIAATSLVAGIASTLTLTGISLEVITTADQLRGRAVAVLARSPGEAFATRYGARVRGADSLAAACASLDRREVDAVIYDRPQLQYFLKQRNADGIAISAADYAPQNYGFALSLNSTVQHELNLSLLQMGESGAMNRIVQQWLGTD
ncbi:MAG: transporter substrate-binding domain-containing protein [Bryobacteraceae bacterium]